MTTNPTCAVPECAKPTRSPKSTLCPMHYHRQYRHGSVHMVSTGLAKSGAPRKYQSLYAPAHPLAMKNGKIYAHRAVLYDTIGDGDHECHWCHTSVAWKPHGNATKLLVDHVDGDRLNNTPSNLVPSCNACNAGRAIQSRSSELRNMGFWSANDTIAALSSRRRRDPIVGCQ